MARLGAKREHVRVDDFEVTQFLELLLFKAPRDGRLFGGTAAYFRKCFDLILDELHVPSGEAHGLTPASLRSGGATFWYKLTDSPEWVRFRGRWATSRMLEIYIQEVASLTVLADLPLTVRSRLIELADQAPYLLSAATQRLRDLHFRSRLV